ncbi:RNA polymerase ECF-type sigma factor [Pedobacter sp. BAL39]|uniref:RNA polymerase sigma factor n=1 Tax=Pedobacter sp. BAL39 TaxID=391596 RepID=UPI0001559342|nr:RNA polymerase sigma-70 factor [Pedobacter sp. BAL39]EDM35374.1 RNA polymerase ECF-type sigma factor [Pedobacter sp. BAL39]
MIDYRKISDFELVTLIKSDDHVAFDTIYKRYTPVLIRFVYSKIKDDEDTKDIIQTVFAKLWDKRNDLNEDTAFQAYIFKLVKNKILDYFRHIKITQSYIERFQNYIDQSEDTADYRARHNNLHAVIEREVNALPPKMKRVYEMSRKGSMSRKEIAEALDLPEQTVNSQMKGALKILRDKLGLFGYLYLIYFLSK